MLKVSISLYFIVVLLFPFNVTTEQIPSKSTSNACKYEAFAKTDVVILNESSLLLTTRNTTVRFNRLHSENNKVYACLHLPSNSTRGLLSDCENKFVYESHEYRLLRNGSVLLYDEVIPPGEFSLDGSKLLVCSADYDSGDWPGANDTSSPESDQQMIFVGQIGSGISILALSVHLVMFCAVPTLRNLPGWNLASLSLAFLLAYTFVLVGQIPQVLGVYCVLSGLLQQDLFLSAFFWMNVLAFDVWRTLKLATEKLRVSTRGLRQFLWYSLYAWGCPLLITTTTALLDNLGGVPPRLKPFFGRDDTCWMTNDFAKTVFFAAPAFTLFLANGFFFVRSFLMIAGNSMKSPSDQHRHNAATTNYALYLRLGAMMGLTWLLGIVATFSRSRYVWLVHDALNSLQGLFLCLLFTCSRKVLRHIRGKAPDKSCAQGSVGKVSAHSFVTSSASGVSCKVISHKC